MESLIRQGSCEFAGKLMNELMKRLQETFLSNTSSLEERHGSLSVITSISSISSEEVCSQIPKLIHILHLEINGRRDSKSMEQAAEVLAIVISNSGILMNELVLTETSASIERIQGTLGLSLFYGVNYFQILKAITTSLAELSYCWLCSIVLVRLLCRHICPLYLMSFGMVYSIQNCQFVKSLPSLLGRVCNCKYLR